MGVLVVIYDNEMRVWAHGVGWTEVGWWIRRHDQVFFDHHEGC